MRAKAAVLYAALPLACLLLLAGCFPAAGPAYKVGLYTLEYPPQAVKGAPAPTDQVVRIARFSIAQGFNSTSMVYGPEPYRLAVYQYHRWRVNPADMAGDYLARDFRASGLFKAVFSGPRQQAARFEVEGIVDQFLQSKEAGGWKAVLVLEITLLDTSKPSVAERVVFQKRYGAAEPLAEQSPAAFAKGMSAAMARVSAEIIGDTAAAIAAR
jgi:ABC-type uncharacterized transport system auxiliary subunit